MQTISQAGLAFIAHEESFAPNRYPDPPGSGLYSIGYGHQIKPGESFDDPISQELAQQLLAQDTAIAQAAIHKNVTAQLTQAQFDALTSFVFNVGVHAFESGTVPAKLNEGDFTAAADTMKRYVHDVNGNVRADLIARRELEAAAFA